MSRKGGNDESVYGRAASQKGHSVYAPVDEDEIEDDPFSPEDIKRARRDSQSTFFGRSEYPDADLARESGGRASLYGQPHHAEDTKSSVPWEEDNGGAFDIYADFNNAGPRYAEVTNPETFSKARDGYRNINTPPPSTRGPKSTRGFGGPKSALPDPDDPVELVTVPRFGPEWTKEEIRLMSKKGQKEDRSLERRQRWREWNQDRRGLWGQKWLTRKVIVWVVFVTIILAVVLIVICIPRVPSFGFNPVSPLVAGRGDPSFTRGPEANFTFSADLDLEMSTSGNIIPLHMNNIGARIYEKDTNALIATGHTGGFTQTGGTRKPLNVSVVFHYSANNDSDTTWNLVYNACKSSSLYASGSRPGLNIILVLDLAIRGLIGKKHASTAISNLACPIQLPTSSV